MSAIEDQIRAALAEDEARTPDAETALRGIHRGISRRRQRRVGAVAAITVAAAAAVTVPTVWHGTTPRPGKSPARPTSVPTAASHRDSALSVVSTLAPTWLPAGYVETERAGQTSSYAGRIFGKPGSDGFVWVTDQRTPKDLHSAPTEHVTVHGRTGQGWWLDAAHRGYRLQVQWSPGHWLWLTVRDTGSARSTALRVANSIVLRQVDVVVPLRCTARYCADLPALDITGVPHGWTASATGPSVSLSLRRGKALHNSNGTINGHRAQIGTGSIMIDFGHGQVVTVTNESHRLSANQLLATAKTVSLSGPADYSWIDRRP